MTEYIEREAISEEIRKYYYKNPPNSSYEEGFDRGLDRAQRAILDAPAADVAPVRHGRWVDNHCTACGMMPMGDEMWKNHGFEPPLFDRFMDYCPSCGAKMDEGAGNGC